MESKNASIKRNFSPSL